MNKLNVTNYAKALKRFAKKKSPEILTGLGIAGMITTTVLAVKATPKALQLIEEEKLNKGIKNAENNWDERKKEFVYEKEKTLQDEEAGVIPKVKKLTPVETIKVAWKPYIPAGLLGMASIACLIGANSVHTRRHAALYSAYKLSETALSEYREKVVETIGEKKEKAVREKVAKDKVDSSTANRSEVTIVGTGEVLFYEPISDRYFMSTIETIRRIINDMNYAMSYGSEMYVSLSQVYDELGLKHTSISDDIGWNIDKGLVEADFSTTMTDDGKPCIVLDWLEQPTYNFDNLY